MSAKHWEKLRASYRAIPLEKTYTILRYKVDNTYAEEKTEDIRWQCGLTDAQVRVGTTVQLLFDKTPYKAKIVGFAPDKEQCDSEIKRIHAQRLAREGENEGGGRSKSAADIDIPKGRPRTMSMVDDDEEEEEEGEEQRNDHPFEQGEQKTRRSRRKRTAARSIDDAMLNGGVVKEEKDNQGVKRCKKLHVKQEADVCATMQCVVCDYSTSFVHQYCSHLRGKHKTTATKEGLWFGCECGNLCRSDSHERTAKCDLNTSILRDEDAILMTDGYKEEMGEEEEVEENSSSTNPHCLLCEFRPSTVGGFFKHMAKKHKTTLNLKGYSIKCAVCGGEFMTNKGQRTHMEIIKCEGRSFSLQKLKKNENIHPTLNINRSFPPIVRSFKS